MGNRDNSGLWSTDYIKKIMFLREQKQKIESGELSPVLTTFLYQLKHLERGGNLATYTPLVRTENYAGTCRRKKIHAAMPSRSNKDAGYAGRCATC